MRHALFISLFSFACFALVAGLSQYANNANNLQKMNNTLQAWARSLPEPSFQQQKNLRQQLRERSMLYEEAIQKGQLLDGMVVSRSKGGRPRHECDSLLFSALRYIALKKLEVSYANQVWLDLEKANRNGLWYRHPRCQSLATSRDMILGVIAALTQNPPHTEDHIRDLFQQIETSGGYLAQGPIYVSYMTPNLARLLRLISRAHSLPYHMMPDAVRRGYSTNEWALPLIESGYRTHLVGLATWIDLELAAQGRNTLNQMDRLNLSWMTHKLVNIDEQNLFFRYLRLRTANALTPAVTFQLAHDLLSMTAFPETRLPNTCDRKADYLWQRHSREYDPQPGSCGEIHPGVDFLWMTGLLEEIWQQQAVAH